MQSLQIHSTHDTPLTSLREPAKLTIHLIPALRSCLRHINCPARAEGLGPYLQNSHLLSVAQQTEGEGMFGVQPWNDLTPPQRQRGHVRLQICPVFVQQQLVVF